MKRRKLQINRSNSRAIKWPRVAEIAREKQARQSRCLSARAAARIHLFGENLCQEYTFRYNKIHATSRVIQECKNTFFAGNIPYFFPVSNDIPVYNTLDCPALAMPDEFKFKNDAVKSYRHYYALNKFFTIDFRYKRRQQPEWISEIQNENKEIVRRYKESNT
jgi:hypothetical protein